ncbi:hypothetical protein KQI49_03685 [Virgibacillus sp. MSJ-26]|uniref:hypothetical protein n=1 Tax=Virgibacillus sp. MSJ-26 TaxID=2841522 RepID=UPI001C0FD1FE|nr:hypothetical protein [Virgibacillus sp. MSJ-26]MBU5465928.1 hypothetical protein [Virgibacillus sp. MSJ-26]
MRNIIVIITTLVVLVGLGYLIAYFTYSAFIDYAGILGIAVTVIIWFFNSKGGHASRLADAKVQGYTDQKLQKQKYAFTPNIAFYTSLVYSVIMLIALIYHYREYF